MSSPQFPSDQLQELAARVVSRPDTPFCTPGLAVVIAPQGGESTRVCVGTDAVGEPIRTDTLFPIASATKLATGLALLRLVEQGLVDVDAPLRRYLPRARAADTGITLRQMTSHTSGLPLDLDPARTPLTRTLDWRGIAQGCLDTPLQYEPATRVQYSNVAYGLLALVMEHVTGEDFKAVLERLVIEPLGIEAYIGRVPPRRPAVVDYIDSPYLGTELEPYNSAFWWQLGTPWAGMYTTADGLLALIQPYADFRPDLLGPVMTAAARTDQTHGLAGGFGTTDPFLGFNNSRSITWPRCPWGLVVELRGDKRPHWTPTAATPESFGQIGASGCVAWCDPARGVSWVALAPRTTDSGWLVRHGSAFGSVAFQHAAVTR